LRAAIFTEPGNPLSIEDVQPSDPGPHDVVVEVAASGVCHSDLSVVDGSLPYPPPLILGHEGCGTVTWVGASVSTVAVGDLVITSPDPMCGRCWFCVNGQPNLCELLAQPPVPRAGRADGTPVSGMSGLGTFADAMVVNEAYVVPVRSDLPPEQLALIGCGVSTGVGAALNTAAISPGATVAVIGCGGVGLAAIQGARLAGGTRVIAVDLAAHKLAVAAEMGATDVVDPAQGDPVAQVVELTGGRGVDVALEVVGLVDTTQQSLAMARRGGTVVVVGAPRFDARLELSAWEFFFGQKRLTSSIFGGANIRRDFPRYVALAEQGRLNLGGLISKTISLGEVNDALDALKRGEVIRSVIVG
jgi:S-(hydroxymethyl)glutathione dehydrogenase / alcohol dehydrogenase